MQRRSALQLVGALSAAIVTKPSDMLKVLETKYQESLSTLTSLSKVNETVVVDETFWTQIRQAYSVSQTLIN